MHRPRRAARRQRRGLALVELLVVIAIIALLLSILTPTLKQAVELGRQVKCLSNEHQIAPATQTYATAYRGRLPCGLRGYPYATLS